MLIGAKKDELLFDEQMRQRQHEIDVAKELGIVLDTDPSQVSDQGSFQTKESKTEKTSKQKSVSKQEELD